MQLPCTSGGQDGVCLALTQLSKELLDTDTSGVQAGGCDSSDCLFCQYRSNSPFHLNAYAGKLTSLLRKRSLNGMALSSLNSLIDTSSSQGAALLAAATAAIGSNGKRQRASTTSAGAAPQSASAGPSDPTTSSAVGDVAAQARSSDAEHDCSLHCREGACRGHGSNPDGRTASTSDSEDAALAQSAEGPVSSTGAATPSDPTAATQNPDPYDAAHHADPQPTTATATPFARSPADPQDPAGPGPSSLLLQLQFQHRHEGRLHSGGQQHRDRGRHQPPPLPQSPPPPGPNPVPPQTIHQHHQQRQMLGQPLPDGWSFQPEWQDRQDPAPALLVPVLRLPDSTTTACGRDGRHRRAAGGSGLPGPLPSVPPSTSSSMFSGGCPVGSSGCGIICALEFSPDGRLLAAGGVDKQIRLYNLSEAFGDILGNDDEEEDDFDDEEGLLAGCWRGGPDCVDDIDGDERRRLERSHRHAGPPGLGIAGPQRGAGGGGSALRRGGRGDGGSDDEGSDDEGAGRGCSLLAAVQRMPSKISSMAWSPHMDGMLTVGDYDGVILQLHIASGHQVADVDAHGGRKIWSVAHSCRIPYLVASAADDRCARLWAGRGLSHCVATLQPNPRAAVCSVDFSPGQEHLLALACSDRTAYLYDMRSLGGGPMAALRHHSRPASYCRFLGADQLVTAATDASLALWDIQGASPVLAATMTAASEAVTAPPSPPPPSAAALMSPFQVVQSYDPLLLHVGGRERQPQTGSQSGTTTRAHTAAGDAPSTAPPQHGRDGRAVGTCSGGAPPAEPRRVFRGHRNEKNFVGLSVRAADRLLACGSECSRAYAYHTSWSDPLATLDLPGAQAAAVAASGGVDGGGLPGRLGRQDSGGSGGGGFVSAVCWQPYDAAAVLGLPPLLASATSMGAVSLSVLAARR